MTGLALLFVTSFLVGWLAQAKKRRTGALWGFFTFLVLVVLWFALMYSVDLAGPSASTIELERRFPGAWQVALDLMVCLGGGLLMTFVVFTLPKKAP